MLRTFHHLPLQQRAREGEEKLRSGASGIVAWQHEVAPEINKTATAALQAFDTELPLSARVAWALEDKLAQSIIREWEPQGDLCKALDWAAKTPDFTQTDAASFKEAC